MNWRFVKKLFCSVRFLFRWTFGEGLSPPPFTLTDWKIERMNTWIHFFSFMRNRRGARPALLRSPSPTRLQSFYLKRIFPPSLAIRSFFSSRKYGKAGSGRASRPWYSFQFCWKKGDEEKILIFLYNSSLFFWEILCCFLVHLWLSL